MLSSLLHRVPPWAPVALASALGAGVVVDQDHREAPTNLAGEPAYYNRSGAAAFRACRTVDSDVVLVSYPKCGTSWAHSIVYAMLRMDARGSCGDDDDAPASALGFSAGDVMAIDERVS